MKSIGFLKRGTSSLQGSGGLNRGNSRLGTQTRIKARASSSGRMINGIEIWSLQEADKRIKKFIFDRDGNKCVVTGDTEFLTPSHYHGRGIYSVRFDPDNLLCINLWTHQLYEEDKKGEYTDLMIKILGKERFAQLNKRANITVKKDDAIINCMKFLKAL